MHEGGGSGVGSNKLVELKKKKKKNTSPDPIFLGILIKSEDTQGFACSHVCLFVFLGHVQRKTSALELHLGIS